MDVKYFKSQICDELKGAKAYIKMAIELKPMAPSWSKMLVEMSASELKHAEYLYKMLGEYCEKISAAYKTMPSYIEDCRTEATDMYLEESVKIKAMHDMYNQ